MPPVGTLDINIADLPPPSGARAEGRVPSVRNKVFILYVITDPFGSQTSSGCHHWVHTSNYSLPVGTVVGLGQVVIRSMHQ